MIPPAASASTEPAFQKPIWSNLFGPPWLASLFILAVLASVRFFAILGPYPLQELFFLQTVAMWALPFLLLTASGRHEIGLTGRGVTLTSMVLGALAGSACGLVLFGLGMEIYGDSPNNWCISIRNYLRLEEMRGLVPPLGMFALYALPAILLNPIGEEILFRGVIQQAFARRFNPALATVVNSVLFGLMYLSLHGLWHDAAGFHVRLASAALSVFLMGCIGGVFTICRFLSGSLWSAVAAHAAFNLTILGASVYHYFR
jgi:hypothetical protein